MLVERPNHDTSNEPQLSRLARMRKNREEENYHPEMPSLDAGGYLVEFLFEVGPVLGGGMGPCPLTHGELAAWQRNVGITLEPFEVRWLRRLSMEYLNESHSAAKADCPAPWSPRGAEFNAEERRVTAKRVQESMRALTKL